MYGANPNAAFSSTSRSEYLSTPANCNGHLKVTPTHGLLKVLPSGIGSGWTALHVAASRGNYEGIKMIVELGGDIRAEDERHRTPLQCYEEYAKQQQQRALPNGSLNNKKVLGSTNSSSNNNNNNNTSISSLNQLQQEEILLHLKDQWHHSQQLFKNDLNCREYSDVKLVFTLENGQSSSPTASPSSSSSSSPKEIFYHKIILASRSRRFARMLKDDLNMTKIEIKETSYDNFLPLLQVSTPSCLLIFLLILIDVSVANLPTFSHPFCYLYSLSIPIRSIPVQIPATIPSTTTIITIPSIPSINW